MTFVYYKFKHINYAMVYGTDYVWYSTVLIQYRLYYMVYGNKIYI